MAYGLASDVNTSKGWLPDIPISILQMLIIDVYSTTFVAEFANMIRFLEIYKPFQVFLPVAV